MVTLKAYICALYVEDMAQNTMGTKLPRKLEQKMQIVGEQIKLARLRRNLSVVQIAERSTCPLLTASLVGRKELLQCLSGFTYGGLYTPYLQNDILHLAKDDELGHRLQHLSLINRHRASKKELAVQHYIKNENEC